jgi:hypothetical protein
LRARNVLFQFGPSTTPHEKVSANTHQQDGPADCRTNNDIESFIALVVVVVGWFDAIYFHSHTRNITKRGIARCL